MQHRAIKTGKPDGMDTKASSEGAPAGVISYPPEAAFVARGRGQGGRAQPAGRISQRIPPVLSGRRVDGSYARLYRYRR